MTRWGYHVTAESIVFTDGDDSDAIPRVGEPHRQILEPLTDRQLVACLRQVRWDRHEHIRAKHSRNEFLPWHLVHLLEKIVEKSPTPDQHELFMTAVANAVSEYWSHVTKGHRRHPGSAEHYLRWLVRRIQRRRSTWWVRQWDRHVVRARGAPSGRAAH
jgi:hypothetical protein